MTAATGRRAEPAATEAEILDLLERHYAKPGNGGSGEYAFLRHVRNAAGFNATRTFDAMVVGLWPSRGHDLHVLEVKVSRSDWKRELAKPAKAEDAAAVADRFSVVAPRGIIDPAEVPATWGIIEAHGGVERFEPSPPVFDGDRTDRQIRMVEGRKLRVVRAAPLLRSPEECRGPIPRGVLVAMLRAAGAVPDPVPPQQAVIDAAVRDALARRANEEAKLQEVARNGEREARETLTAFQNAAGLYWSTPDRMRQVADEVRQALAAARSPLRAARSLDHAREQLKHAAAILDQAATDLAAQGDTPR